MTASKRVSSPPEPESGQPKRAAASRKRSTAGEAKPRPAKRAGGPRPPASAAGAPRKPASASGAPGSKAAPLAGAPSSANPPAPEQATVLDWFRSVLQLHPIPIPEPGTAAVPAPRQPLAAPAAAGIGIRLTAAQLRFPVALLLAFLAQAGLEKRGDGTELSIVLYLVAGAMMAWAAWAGDLQHQAPVQAEQAAPVSVRLPYLAAALLFSALTYLTSGGNLFRPLTVPLWAAAILAALAACWEGEIDLAAAWARLRTWVGQPRLRLELDRWAVLWVAAFAVCGYFRFHQLAEVPYEMWSDHAEKFLDIIDVLNGDTSIFFPRNAGREPIQFYATAAAAKWLGADLSFLTLKTVTALAGLLTLPFIYLVGREIAGRWAGLVAMLLAGISYWPNVLSRVGMRLPFHPLFAAPAMFFLLRGLRQGRRNDLLLSGVALGAGLYGYTAARITPLVILAGLAVFLLHRMSWARRRRAVLGFAMLVFLALVVATPMLHAAYDKPEDLFYRTVTRVSDAERPLPGEPLQIFLSNMWHALRMFAWEDGEIWVLAIPFRPMLDWVVGALFHLGLVFLAVRALRRRSWADLFLLLSIPLMLLPSALALAFPGENPHPSRAGGAMVPVFVIAALPLAALPDWAGQAFQGARARWAGLGAAGALLVLAGAVNYQLTFEQYGTMVRRGAWNTSEVGAYVRGFAQSVGSYDNVYVVSYPHWMDSRLVADIAGRPGQDLGLWPELLAEVGDTPEAQLFLLHPDAQTEIDYLRNRFPEGSLTRIPSAIEGRDFLSFFVPAAAEFVQEEPS